MKHPQGWAHGAAALFFMVFAGCSKEDGHDGRISETLKDIPSEDSLVPEKEESEEASPARVSVDRAAQESEEEMMARIRAEGERRAAERQRKRKESRQRTASVARAAFAGKKLPDFKTRDERPFEQVTVMEADDLELTIMHASGAAKIPYPDLPEDLQKRLHYHQQDYKEALAARESAGASPQVPSESATATNQFTGSTNSAITSASADSETATVLDGEDSEMPDFAIELTKAQGELRQTILELNEAKLKIRQMYSNFARGVQSQADRQRVQQMTGHLNQLRLKEARWKAETDALRLATLIRAHQYGRLKPIWEAFRKAQHEATAAKAQETSASDNIGWLESLESSARLKSASHQNAVKSAEAVLRQAERVRAQKETEARVRRQAFDKAFAAS